MTQLKGGHGADVPVGTLDPKTGEWVELAWVKTKGVGPASPSKSGIVAIIGPAHYEPDTDTGDPKDKDPVKHTGSKSEKPKSTK